MNQGLRTFYIIILTQTLSLMGSRISGLALGIYVFQDTGNATPLALVALFSTIPFLLMNNIAGWMADRYDRRYVMALADSGQAVATLLLLFSFLSGSFELWHLYALTALGALFGAFQGPAFSASVTMLVPDAERDRANTIRQLTGPIAGIFAPALAGLIYAAGGVIAAILVDLLTFSVAMVVILMVRIPRPERSAESLAAEGSLRREMLLGLRYLWQRRPLLLVVIYAALLNFLLNGTGVLLTPYLLGRTGSEAMLGFLLGATNIGPLLGGVLFGWRGVSGPRMHAILWGLLLCGAALALSGLAQHPLTLFASIFLIMLPLPMINSLFMSILQAKVAPDVQGRVFSVMEQSMMLLTPVAFLLAGPLADQVFEPLVQTPTWDLFAPFLGAGVGAGMGLMFVVGGVVLVLITLGAFTLREVREMDTLLPDHAPAPVTSESPAESFAMALGTD